MESTDRHGKIRLTTLSLLLIVYLIVSVWFYIRMRSGSIMEALSTGTWVFGFPIFGLLIYYYVHLELQKKSYRFYVLSFLTVFGAVFVSILAILFELNGIKIH